MSDQDKQDPPVTDAERMVALRAPEGMTECSWQARTFKVGKTGLVKVPEAAVADLVAHGLAPQ